VGQFKKGGNSLHLVMPPCSSAQLMLLPDASTAIGHPNSAADAGASASMAEVALERGPVLSRHGLQQEHCRAVDTQDRPMCSLLCQLSSNCCAPDTSQDGRNMLVPSTQLWVLQSLLPLLSPPGVGAISRQPPDSPFLHLVASL
jgi:hypothetical protein